MKNVSAGGGRQVSAIAAALTSVPPDGTTQGQPVGDYNLHGVTTPRNPHPAMNELMHWGLLMLVPMFVFMAVVGNTIIFCACSSNKLKRFRAALYIRYVALSDIAASTLSLGLLWIGVTLSEGMDLSSARTKSCKVYTTLRFTAQDMSTWGLLLLLCERFGSLFAPRVSSCLTLDLAVGSWMLRIRHVYTILCLALLSTMVLMTNLYLVEYARRDGDVVIDVRDCFNTWKSAADLKFGSLSVIHVMEGSAMPSLFFLLAYIVLKVLQVAIDSFRPAHNRGGNIALSNLNCEGDSPRLDVLVHVPPSPVLNVGGDRFVEEQSAEDLEQASKFRLCLIRMTAWWRRVKPVVKLFDEDREYAVPPPHVDRSLHAMARAHALFFFFMQIPQVLFTLSACQLLAQGGWPLLKNLGLASDMFVNNKATFVLFVYNFSGGKVFQGAVLNVLKNIVSCCRHFFDPSDDRAYQGQNNQAGVGQVRVQGHGRNDYCYWAYDGPYAQEQDREGGEGERQGRVQGQNQGQNQGQASDERESGRATPVSQGLRPAGQARGQGQGRRQGGAGRGQRSQRREFNVLPQC